SCRMTGQLLAARHADRGHRARRSALCPFLCAWQAITGGQMAETIWDILERDRLSRQGITRLVGADALRVISEHSRESAPVLGVDARTGEAVSVDLDAESPHVLFSMASGAGKSATLRLLLAQHLMHGAN